MNEVRKVYHFDMVPIVISSLGYADIYTGQAPKPVIVKSSESGKVFNSGISGSHSESQDFTRVTEPGIGIRLAEGDEPHLWVFLDLALIAADMFIPRMQGPAFSYVVSHHNKDPKDWAAPNLYWKPLPIRKTDAVETRFYEEFSVNFQALAQARKEAKKKYLEGKLT